jgi:UDP-hydrolysing UDP-N-acetyl-D-glucosamine 2-epimerase
MNKKKICVITGSRADYGLLYWLMKHIQNDGDLKLQVIATGMHLSHEFGLTYLKIEQDGFSIDAKVEMLLSSDSSVGVAKSIGLAVIGFADVLDRLKPDIVVLLGDRFEILAAAQAALIARIPVAHIAGGDTTEGAVDEAIRHSITKMSHLHFATNEASAKRISQLGENPDHIFNVGSPGIDGIKQLKLMGRKALEKALHFDFRPKNLLITFHPATLDIRPAQEQFKELLDALDQLGSEIGLIFTKPNADMAGRILIDMIDDYVTLRPYTQAYVSLGSLLYLSTVANVDAVVGNSSSGLYEVPSFRKPTVNIGDRQKGRIKASSVIDCEPTKDAILASIHRAFEMDCSGVKNPYGDGKSSILILQELKKITNPQSLLKKHFFNLPT